MEIQAENLESIFDSKEAYMDHFYCNYVVPNAGKSDFEVAIEYQIVADLAEHLMRNEVKLIDEDSSAKDHFWLKYKLKKININHKDIIFEYWKNKQYLENLQQKREEFEMSKNLVKQIYGKITTNINLKNYENIKEQLEKEIDRIIENNLGDFNRNSGHALA